MQRVKALGRYVVVVVAMLMMSSCASSLSRKVSVEGYEKLQVMGFSGVRTNIVFRNESGRNIGIKATNVALKRSGDTIAIFSLKEELEIPRRTESISLPTLWRMHSIDIMAAMLASKQIIGDGEVDLDPYRVDIEAQVKVGGAKRTLKQRNIRLDDILRNME